MGRLIAAAVQMNSGVSVNENLEQALTLALDAVNAGALLIVLPENFALMSESRQMKLEIAETLGNLNDPIQRALAQFARQHRVTLVAGSLPTRCPDPNRVYTTQLVFGSSGKLLGHYHKIHLFDVEVPDDTSVYKESATFMPGDVASVLRMEEIHLGLSICYDLRFGSLYAVLRQAGADVVTVPSAFTHVTGQAHWTTLVRARAIEQQVYVVAANQCGAHEGGRRTYGHSMIVDPWGDVLAQAEEQPQVIMAEVDTDHLTAVRTRMPILMHSRGLISVVNFPEN